MRELSLEQVGKRLRRIRSQMELTREQFAEQVSISPQFLAEIENGKKIVRQQKSIPQIQGFPWICGIFLFVHFSEFLSVSNKLETK